MECRIPSLGIQGYSALLLCALLATLQGISNGDLLCSCKGSCRRSFDAMVQLEPLCGPSVNYSHIFLLNWQTLRTTKRGLRLQNTLQRISNGDLCSSMGTCRRSFDATVQLAPLYGPSLIRSSNEQTLKTTKSELQRISNGDGPPLLRQRVVPTELSCNGTVGTTLRPLFELLLPSLTSRANREVDKK